MSSQKFNFSVTVFLLLVFSLTTSAQTSGANSKRIRTYDVQHYTIRVNFDRQKRIVYGETTIQLKPLGESFNTVELDAAGMSFQSIKLEPENVELEFKTDNAKVFIALDKSYAPDDLITIRLKYSTKPKKGVYFVDAIKKDGVITRAAQVWSQGEADESHFWFPCYDFPDDKATSEEYITTEKGEIAVGNGELLEIIENPDETKTFHFKMPVPHSSYLTSFVVGTYTKVADKYKDIPLGYYVYPGKDALAQTAYGKTKEMMRVYEELTGVDFPYNKYDQTMVAEFQFGGMENITATTMADTEILFSEYGFGKNIVEDLVSHELSHSWFGDLVTCKSWSELWLNEGFATFMEAAYREKMYGREDYLRKITEDADQFIIADARSKRRPPLYNPKADTVTLFDEPEFIYQKGGAVIHTLRETVGTENFWKAINIYLNRHKFANVETADLQKAMEETSGMDLNWFFKQWVYGAGYPRLLIKQYYNPKTKTLNLTVSQTQKVDGVTPTAFYLPLDVEITTAKGVRQDNILIKTRAARFSIKVDGAPKKVVFDKNEKIPIKLIN